jgi:hypothetical protein
MKRSGLRNGKQQGLFLMKVTHQNFDFDILSFDCLNSKHTVKTFGLPMSSQFNLLLRIKRDLLETVLQKLSHFNGLTT